MRISVIVICYNQEKYIRKCLDSVMDIDYDDYEVIIEDDGSTDGSANVCKEYSNRYDNVTYIYEDNSGGAATPRNNGIIHASGDYITFVDGDDTVEPDILSVLSSVVQNDDNIDIVIGGYYAVDGAVRTEHSFFPTDIYAESPPEKEMLYLQLLDGSYCNHNGATAVGVPWGRLYSRDLLNAKGLRFPTDMKRLEDNVFNMFAFCDARKIVCIQHPVYDYRLEHISSLTTEGQDSFQKVIRYRNEFLTLHQEYATHDIIAYKWNETISYLKDGIREHIDDRHQIDQLVKLPVYKPAINDINPNGKCRLRFYAWLIKHQLVGIYVFLRKLKYFFKGNHQ